MSRPPARRLEDILLACDAIDEHLRRGPADDPPADGLVLDAVRVRLIEIGEAAKDLPADLTAAEPDLPWREIAGMRDQLAQVACPGRDLQVQDCRTGMPGLLSLTTGIGRHEFVAEVVAERHWTVHSRSETASPWLG